LQAHRELAKAVKCRLQILYDFGGDLVGRCQHVVVFVRIVLEPEDVKISLDLGRLARHAYKRRKRSVPARSRRLVAPRIFLS
jgi:hypothetical protein